MKVKRQRVALLAEKLRAAAQHLLAVHPSDLSEVAAQRDFEQALKGADLPQSCLFHQRYRLHLYPKFEPRFDAQGCSGPLRQPGQKDGIAY